MKKLACALAVTGSVSAMGLAVNPAAASQTRNGLQLSILTPDPTSIGDQLSLDVVAKGGVIETVELYIDNALAAKRQLNTAQSRNILTFKLDTMLMTAGDHEVVVKAYGPDGKSSTSSAKVRIPSLDLNAPVRIAYPGNGQAVSGVVPIRMSLDSDVMKLKPYVTFFVDKEFKVLRNTPPYEFQWDTTKSVNGWHLLEAWSQDNESPNPVKSRPVHVNVNNGGGETKLNNEVKDLREPSAISLSTPAKPSRPAPTTSNGVSNPGKINANLVADGNHGKVSASGNGVTSEPSPYGFGKTSSASAGALQLVAPSTGAVKLAPSVSGGAAQQPADRIAITSAPKGSLPGIQDESLIPIISRAAAPTTNAGSFSTSRVKPMEVKSIRTDQVIARAGGSFQVAFNGTQIAFDVQPRIEAGVKLAPFRQIFEHSGGRLYWYGGNIQTVRAVNEAKEIEIKIGNPTAKVNNKSLKMEKTPYIESGRTIVPLSFIKDSMDVKIQFDEKSGQLLIESNK